VQAKDRKQSPKQPIGSMEAEPPLLEAHNLLGGVQEIVRAVARSGIGEVQEIVRSELAKLPGVGVGPESRIVTELELQVRELKEQLAVARGAGPRLCRSRLDSDRALTEPLPEPLSEQGTPGTAVTAGPLTSYRTERAPPLISVRVDSRADDRAMTRSQRISQVVAEHRSPKLRDEMRASLQVGNPRAPPQTDSGKNRPWQKEPDEQLAVG
jgi:hypothetical protein